MRLLNLTTQSLPRFLYRPRKVDRNPLLRWLVHRQIWRQTNRKHTHTYTHSKHVAYSPRCRQRQKFPIGLIIARVSPTYSKFAVTENSYPFCCTVRKHGHFCRKIYGSSRSSTCVPNVWSSGYAGVTLSETQKLSTGSTFPVSGISSPIHCSTMWWDLMTTCQPTAHYRLAKCHYRQAV